MNEIVSAETLDWMKSQNNVKKMLELLENVIPQNNTRIKYKLGKNKLKNLNISIPSRYNSINQSNGLVEIGIRSILARIRFDGWDNDSLNKVYDDNNFTAVASQAIESSLVCGVGFISIGSGDTSIGDPRIILASENPNEIFAIYDRQKGRVIKAIKVVYSDTAGNVEGYYFQEGSGIREFASYDNTDNILLSEWRDTNLTNNRVPIIALCNNQSFDGRIGHSEISEQWISIVDSQTRTMHALEIAREFSVFPKQVFFGANPEDFMGENGMSNMIDKFNLIADPNGKVQEIGTANIQGILDQIQTYNKAFAQVSDLPESYFGLSSTANPTSAESRTIAENGLINKCTAKIDMLKGSFSNLGRMIMEVLGDEFILDEDSDEVQAIKPNFRDPSTPNQASLVAQVTSLVSAGILNPAAETTLRKLGFDRQEIDSIKREASLGKATSLLESLNLNKEIPAITETIANDIPAIEEG